MKSVTGTSLQTLTSIGDVTMNEKQLKHTIAILLDDARYLQQIAPNAGTEARIEIAEKVLQQGSEKSESSIRNTPEEKSSNSTDRNIATGNEFIRNLEKLLGYRETKLLFLVPVIRKKVEDILEENGIPKEYMTDAMEYSLELVRITPDLTWLDEYQQQFEKGAETLLSAADKTEQKTELLVFWNTVEAIARSRMFEFNNINHSVIDTHQSSHREGVSMLLALLREQGECPQPTSNDTEQ